MPSRAKIFYRAVQHSQSHGKPSNKLNEIRNRKNTIHAQLKKPSQEQLSDKMYNILHYGQQNHLAGDKQLSYQQTAYFAMKEILQEHIQLMEGIQSRVQNLEMKKIRDNNLLPPTTINTNTTTTNTKNNHIINLEVSLKQMKQYVDEIKQTCLEKMSELFISKNRELEQWKTIETASTTTIINQKTLDLLKRDMLNYQQQVEKLSEDVKQVSLCTNSTNSEVASLTTKLERSLSNTSSLTSQWMQLSANLTELKEKECEHYEELLHTLSTTLTAATEGQKISEQNHSASIISVERLTNVHGEKLDDLSKDIQVLKRDLSRIQGHMEVEKQSRDAILASISNRLETIKQEQQEAGLRTNILSQQQIQQTKDYNLLASALENCQQTTQKLMIQIETEKDKQDKKHNNMGHIIEEIKKEQEKQRHVIDKMENLSLIELQQQYKDLCISYQSLQACLKQVESDQKNLGETLQAQLDASASAADHHNQQTKATIASIENETQKRSYEYEKKWNDCEQQWKQELEQVNRENRDLLQKYDQLTNSINELKEQYQQKQDKQHNQDIQDKQQYQLAINETDIKLDKLKMEMNELKNMIATHNDVTALKSLLSEQQEQKYNKTFNDLTCSLNTLTQTSEELKATFQTQWHVLNEKLSHTEASVGSHEKQIDELGAKLDLKYNEAINVATTKATDAITDIMEMKVKQLSNQVNANQEELAQQLRQLQQTQFTLETTMQQRHEESQQQFEQQLHQMKVNLTAQMEDRTQQKYQAMVDDISKDVKTLTTDLTETQQNVHNLELLLLVNKTNLEQHYHSLQQLVKTACTNVEQPLTQQIHNLSEQFNQHELKLITLDDKCNGKCNELDNKWNDKYDALDNRLNDRCKMIEETTQTQLQTQVQKVNNDTQQLHQLHQQQQKEWDENINKQIDTIHKRFQQLHTVVVSNMEETERINVNVASVIECHNKIEQELKTMIMMYENNPNISVGILKEKEDKLIALEAEVRQQLNNMENHIKAFQQPTDGTLNRISSRLDELAQPKYITPKKGV